MYQEYQTLGLYVYFSLKNKVHVYCFLEKEKNIQTLAFIGHFSSIFREPKIYEFS